MSLHSLALVSNLAIVTATLAADRSDVYSAKLQGAGGTSPLTWNATGVPAGLDVRRRRADDQRHTHRSRDVLAHGGGDRRPRQQRLAHLQPHHRARATATRRYEHSAAHRPQAVRQ